MGSVSQHNTHGPINWFSQFFTFGYWRWLNRWSFKPYLIFIQSITTFVVVNWLLNLFVTSTYIVVTFLIYHKLKERQPRKHKNRYLFSISGWFVLLRIALISLYNINRNTFTICKCIPAFNMCILCSHSINIYQTLTKTSIFFWEIFYHVHKQIHKI